MFLPWDASQQESLGRALGSTALLHSCQLLFCSASFRATADYFILQSRVPHGMGKDTLGRGRSLLQVGEVWGYLCHLGLNPAFIQALWYSFVFCFGPSMAFFLSAWASSGHTLHDSHWISVSSWFAVTPQLSARLVFQSIGILVCMGEENLQVKIQKAAGPAPVFLRHPLSGLTVNQARFESNLSLSQYLKGCSKSCLHHHLFVTVCKTTETSPQKKSWEQPWLQSCCKCVILHRWICTITPKDLKSICPLRAVHQCVASTRPHPLLPKLRVHLHPSSSGPQP